MLKFLPDYFFYISIMLLMVAMVVYIPTVWVTIKAGQKQDPTTKLQLFKLEPIFFALLLWFIVSAIRYGIGRDYIGYWHSLDLIRKDWWEYTEPLAYFLSHLIIDNNLAYQWFFAFYALAITVSLYLMFSRIEKRHYEAVIVLLFALSFINFSFNTIRQAVVVPLFVYAALGLHKSNFIRYALVLIIASFFHTSAILLLPFYFWAKLRISKISLYIIVGLSLTLFISKVHVSLLHKLVEAIPYYNRYLGGHHDHKTELGSGLGFMFKLISALIILAFYPNDKDQDNNLRDRVMYRMFALGVVLQLVFFHLWVLSRLTEYFTYMLLVLIPITFANSKHTFNKILIILIGLGNFALWSKDILVPAKNHMVPYQVFYDFENGKLKNPNEKAYKVQIFKK